MDIRREKPFPLSNKCGALSVIISTEDFATYVHGATVKTYIMRKTSCIVIIAEYGSETISKHRRGCVASILSPRRYGVGQSHLYKKQIKITQKKT